MKKYIPVTLMIAGLLAVMARLSPSWALFTVVAMLVISATYAIVSAVWFILRPALAYALEFVGRVHRWLEIRVFVREG